MIARRAFYVMSLAATVAFLAGNILNVLQFLAFAFGILLPATAIALRHPSFDHLRPGQRLPVAGAMVLVAAFPWFYVRRILT